MCIINLNIYTYMEAVVYCDLNSVFKLPKIIFLQDFRENYECLVSSAH